MLEKTIGIAIGIAIGIENNYHTNMFDPDPDSDFDPEKKHQRNSEIPKFRKFQIPGTLYLIL